jgi:dTDP-4-dehydrorhamnose 3,5-epimerase
VGLGFVNETGGQKLILNETELTDAYIVDLEPIADSRGFFARAWCERELGEQGLETRIAQCNMSFNRRKGTIRGMHFQRPPHEEVKLIRCIRGALFDVIIDLRPESATYKNWIGVELSDDNRRALYVPKGFAHGFQTLVDNTETFYMVSAFYAADAGAGVRWDDPAFGIDWPLGQPTEISDNDRNWPDFVDTSQGSP